MYFTQSRLKSDHQNDDSNYSKDYKRHTATTCAFFKGSRDQP